MLCCLAPASARPLTSILYLLAAISWSRSVKPPILSWNTFSLDCLVYFLSVTDLYSDIDDLRHPARVRVDPLDQHGAIAEVAGGQPLRQPEHDQLGVRVTEGGVSLARKRNPGPGLQLHPAAGDGEVVVVAGQPQPVHGAVHRARVDEAVVARIVDHLFPRVFPGHCEAEVSAVQGQCVVVVVRGREADIGRAPGHREVAMGAGLSAELAYGLWGRGAAEDLKPKALVIVTHPSEAGAHPDPNIASRDEISKGVGLDHPSLLFLVIQVEAGPVRVLAAAILPQPPVHTDLHSETDITTQCKHYLKHSFHHLMEVLCSLCMINILQ